MYSTYFTRHRNQRFRHTVKLYWYPQVPRSASASARPSPDAKLLLPLPPSLLPGSSALPASARPLLAITNTCRGIHVRLLHTSSLALQNCKLTRVLKLTSYTILFTSVQGL